MVAKPFEMSADQKFLAMSVLCDSSIRIDTNGAYYISTRMYRKHGSIEESIVGRGQTPEMAIINHWEQLMKATYSDPVYVDRGGKRTAYIWDACLWREIA